MIWKRRQGAARWGGLHVRLPTSRNCFVCGRENPIGLQIGFTRTEEGSVATVTPGAQFQGFDGILQGGVAAGMMDDAMWWAIFGQTGAITMTAELNVRYRKPAPVGVPLTVRGRVVGQRRSLYECAAAIAGPDGAVLLEATGKFLTAPRELAERLTAQLHDEPPS
jgi:acyl-coenzyme A thioesterase PaaI-like protein